MIIGKILFWVWACSFLPTVCSAHKVQETGFPIAELSHVAAATGNVDILLDSSGHTIYTLSIQLVKDGKTFFRELNGHFADGTTLSIGDLEPGDYRVFCTGVTGVWPGPHTSVLKGNFSPQTITVVAGRTASVMLEISR